MAKYTEKELMQLQKRLEAENAKLQEEKRQLQEQRAQVMRESEILVDNRRQVQEEARMWEQQRGAGASTGGTVTNFLGVIYDLEKFSLSDDFELWCEQFREFMTVNNLSEQKAVSFFIMKIGTEGYKLLRNLYAPTLPKDKSLYELMTLLQNHLKPKPNVLTQRYRFKECKRKQSESISTYLANFKQISFFVTL